MQTWDPLEEYDWIVVVVQFREEINLPVQLLFQAWQKLWLSISALYYTHLCFTEQSGSLTVVNKKEKGKKGNEFLMIGNRISSTYLPSSSFLAQSYCLSVVQWSQTKTQEPVRITSGLLLILKRFPSALVTCTMQWLGLWNLLNCPKARNTTSSSREIYTFQRLVSLMWSWIQSLHRGPNS